MNPSELPRLIFVLGAVVGCKPEATPPQGDASPWVEPDPPELVAAPEQVEFGDVEVDGAGASRAEVLQLVNAGESTLYLEALELAGGEDGVFEISLVSGVAVEPLEAGVVNLTFTPSTAGTFADTLLVRSNDPAQPVLEVPLQGTGLAPVLGAEAVDFGSTWVGCSLQQTATLGNVGNEELVITAVALTAEAEIFSLDLLLEESNGELPWTLEPGEAVEVQVGYAPLLAGSDTASLLIGSTDPVTPEATVALLGEADVHHEQTDRWELAEPGVVDILVAVDRSISPTSYLERVHEHADALVHNLLLREADFQLAATVEDDGCINGDHLFIDETFASSDAPAVVESMINWGGSYGSNSERGFMLLEAAVGASSVGGCNEGLVRDDAALHLVLVSDEAEQSVNNYSYYVSLFQSLKADPAQVVIHAIGGDYPGGCYSAHAFTGAYEATVATGGQFLSICATDWDASMETLALATTSWVDPRKFELSDWPVLATLTVTVDGVPVTSGWTYNPTDNSVEFDEGQEPAPGSVVELTYATYADCGE